MNMKGAEFAIDTTFYDKKEFLQMHWNKLIILMRKQYCMFFIRFKSFHNQTHKSAPKSKVGQHTKWGES